MKNEYGEKLDNNGYAKSLLPTGVHCYHCFCMGDLERHEVFHGLLFRKRSKKYGCWVTLCFHCHYILHNSDGVLDMQLKEDMQDAAMKHYGWTTKEFIGKFGKNYL